MWLTLRKQTFAVCGKHKEMIPSVREGKDKAQKNTHHYLDFMNSAKPVSPEELDQVG